MAEKILSYFLLACGLFGSIYFVYLSWLKPEGYLGSVRKKRRELMKRGGFNTWFYGPWNKFFDKHMTLDLYQMRIASLIGVFVCVMMIIVIICGPFGN